MSCYRDLNPGPLPYQGSALPLSYNSKKKKSGRRGSNPRPSAWKANALSTELLPHSCQSCHSDCGQRWIRTTEVERQQIYSLPHLATLVFALNISNKELKSNSEQYSEHRCFILSSSSNSSPPYEPNWLPSSLSLKSDDPHSSLEPLVGFEPTTPRLQITCSGQLS